MTPTTTLDASRQRQQQAHPSSPSPAETSSLRKDKDNGPSTSGVGASNEPIWIPSDVDSDSEDDEENGQDFDDSRSDATLPSINSLAAQSQPRKTIHADSPSKAFNCIDVDYVDLTTARASQPPTLAPLDTDDALCEGDDMSVSAAPSRHNSIPRTRDASPQRQPSFETPQGEDHRTSGRGSEDAEARVLSKGAPQPSLGARASPSPPLGPITRRHAHRQAMRRLVQYDDDNSSDAGSESQGSESHLDRANLRCDKDYCPSHTEAKEMGSGDESNNEGQCPRKRRKVSRSSTSLLRDAAASVERPRRGRSSFRSRGKNAEASGILSPASSQATSDETDVGAVLARFEEWPLENASLKRITENGKTTFQLQFDWTPCIKHGHASSTVRDRVVYPRHGRAGPSVL